MLVTFATTNWLMHSVTVGDYMQLVQTGAGNLLATAQSFVSWILITKQVNERTLLICSDTVFSETDVHDILFVIVSSLAVLVMCVEEVPATMKELLSAVRSRLNTGALRIPQWSKLHLYDVWGQPPDVAFLSFGPVRFEETLVHVLQWTEQSGLFQVQPSGRSRHSTGNP